ncbi:unnamed protein product [Callosobruchus maculatus]|nr:unnamed protein product [Callosobruchus maculatus]
MGHLLLLVPHIAMLVGTCVGVLEFAILISNQAKMTRLKNVLQSEIFEYEDCHASQKIVEDSRAFYNRIMIATYLFYWMVGVGGHLSALKDLNAENRAGRYGVNVTCYNLIPHLFVIPFQTNTVKRCKDALMVMDFGLFVLAGYLATHDTLLYAFTSCVDAKFQVVSEATATIRERTELKMQIAKNFGILRDEEIPELEELMYKEIKRCNYSLMTLLSCCEDLESIFCYTLLGRAIASLLLLASCLYVGSFLSAKDPAMYHLIEYFVAAFFQIFMVCFFGFLITERGAAYNTYLYESDWHSCSLRYKRAMLIMMNRMQQPVYLTIGKFYPLSLQAFMQVFKAAFSYATVLKTV